MDGTAEGGHQVVGLEGEVIVLTVERDESVEKRRERLRRVGERVGEQVGEDWTWLLSG